MLRQKSLDRQTLVSVPISHTSGLGPVYVETGHDRFSAVFAARPIVFDGSTRSSPGPTPLLRDQSHSQHHTHLARVVVQCRNAGTSSDLLEPESHIFAAEARSSLRELHAILRLVSHHFAEKSECEPANRESKFFSPFGHSSSCH